MSLMSIYIFALCIASSILVIEFMIYLGMEIAGNPGNTRTGVISTIVTVIGTIFIVWHNIVLAGERNM